MAAEIPLVRSVLPSGLRALCIPMPDAHTAAIAVHVRVGPRFESAETAGLSHFLEHMLHRGTRRHATAHAQALAFEELGATLAAMTYVDHGLLSVSVPPENFAPVMELLAEVCREPIFDSIELERGIVREELLEGVDAEGRSIDPENLLRAGCFPDHGLGYPITGTAATLETFDQKALERHHAAHYHSRLVVTSAGKVDPDYALRCTEGSFELPGGDDPLSSAPAALAGPVTVYVPHRSSQTTLRLGFRAPAELDSLEPATEILLRTLDDGMSTRLYRRLCDERGLCYDVSATYEAYGDAGLLDIAAETSHEQTLEVIDELVAIVRSLRDVGPSEREIEKAKSRHGWQLLEMRDSPPEMTSFYGLGELSGVARTPEERDERLNSVSIADVCRAAQQVFNPENLCLVAVGSVPRRVRAAIEQRLATLA
jgi:predicted Zn-dependent peptidase